jgi:hypothetical protein
MLLSATVKPFVCAIVATLISAIPAQAQAPDSTLWVTNGGVRSIVVQGATVYVGGNFTEVGPSTGCGVPLDISTGLPTPGYPRLYGFNAVVYSVLEDGAGGWFIGGSFTSVGGHPHNAVAHILMDGRVDDWNPMIGGYYVEAMTVSENTLFIAGSFESVGGAPRQYLAAVDIETGQVLPWAPELDSSVRAIQWHGGAVYVGGTFTSINGVSRSGIAALDPVTGSASAWNPHLDGTNGGGAEIRSLMINNSAAFVGGWFSSIGGTGRNNVAALNLVTGQATSWNPNADGPVTALASDGTVIFAGGNFNQIGGQPRGKIAALDPISGAATGWQANANSSVMDIEIRGGLMYVGGLFTTMAGQPRSRLAALDVTSGALTSWDPHAGSAVYALSANATQVYVGGALKSIGGKTRNRLAALDVTSGTALDWNPSVDNGFVESVALLGNSLYVGGFFTSVGGLARNGLAKVDLVSGSVSSWNPSPVIPGSSNRNVTAIVAGAGLVYIGGNFTSVGGASRRGVAALDAATGVPTAWDPQLNSTAGVEVSTLLLRNNVVYIGGAFQTAAGVMKNGLTGVNALTASSVWSAQHNGNYISVLGASPHGIYVGGNFTTIAGASRRDLVEFDDATGLTAWNPQCQSGTITGVVEAGGTVYVCGGFGSIGGQARTYLAALDGLTGSATNWNPQVDGNVQTVAVGGNKVYFGGSFSGVSGASSGGLARVPVSVDAIGVQDPHIPLSFRIQRVAPNPTLGPTRIEFSLPRPGRVGLSVIDVTGREVARIAQTTMSAGNHAWDWNQADRDSHIGAGVYFLCLKFEGQSVHRKIVLLR